MTKKEAQERNYKIMQLLGILPRLKSLIPDDVFNKLSDADKYMLDVLPDTILNAIHTVKHKKFTCAKCTDVRGKHPTKDKTAYKCDICGDWKSKLYRIKQ